MVIRIEKGKKWWRCCFERGADGPILNLERSGGGLSLPALVKPGWVSTVWIEPGARCRPWRAEGGEGVLLRVECKVRRMSDPLASPFLVRFSFLVFRLWNVVARSGGVWMEDEKRNWRASHGGHSWNQTREQAATVRFVASCRGG